MHPNTNPGMENRIENSAPKKLVGKHIPMCLAQNKTAELWRSFMPYRHLIPHRANNLLISMQVFHSPFHPATFTPETPFTKWAVAEVTTYETVPEGMQTFDLAGGLYAVFLYRGNEQGAARAFQYIFGTWLPHSGYEVDQRPHFELLGPKYAPGSPLSEEEIWIPVCKPKG